MRQRVKFIKFLTQLTLFLVFVSSAVAEDSAYKEAMEYFKHRQLASEKPKTKGFFKKEKAPLKFKQSSFSLGFNFTNPNTSGEDLLGGHISFIKKTHPLLRQTVSLEYETQAALDKFSLFHSLYYDRYSQWGPEVALGAGREFNEDSGGSFVAFKLGLSSVDHFGGLLDFRVFFKQEVYFKKSLQSESVGVSLYLKL